MAAKLRVETANGADAAHEAPATPAAGGHDLPPTFTSAPDTPTAQTPAAQQPAEAPAPPFAPAAMPQPHAQAPPPHETVHRALKLPGFHIHLSSPTKAARRDAAVTDRRRSEQGLL